MLPRRRRIRDDLRGAPIGLPLEPDLPGGLVGIQLAAAADPHRNPGQGRSRQAEGVRVQVACLHHRDALAPAPPRERAELPTVAGRANPRIGNSTTEAARSTHARQPGAFAVKAGDVHREALPDRAGG